jgi:hypothetical protein
VVSASTEAALTAYPELQRLIDLGEAGWTFVHHEDVAGVTQIDAFWSWPSARLDCLRIHGATNAMGLRTNGTDPPQVVWELTGGVAEVIHELTTLPPPGNRLAPNRPAGTAPRLWTPRHH